VPFKVILNIYVSIFLFYSMIDKKYLVLLI